MQTKAIFVAFFIVLTGFSGSAQNSLTTADRVSFVLKNTLGYHRMFRAEGPGIAYGFSMDRNEKTPKSWPVGTTLYYSKTGDTADETILTITTEDAGKTLETDGRRPNGAASQANNVVIKLRNNSVLPHKIALISYQPGETGNGTRIFVLAPYGVTKGTYEVGTKLYIADDKQVDVVMSGKRIDSEKPFTMLRKEDAGKTINIFP